MRVNGLCTHKAERRRGRLPEHGAVALCDQVKRYVADLSVFHLVNILMLLAGQYGYIGQFAPTIYALRQALGDDQVFDRPSELRAKSDSSNAESLEPLAEEK